MLKLTKKFNLGLMGAGAMLTAVAIAVPVVATNSSDDGVDIVGNIDTRNFARVGLRVTESDAGIRPDVTEEEALRIAAGVNSAEVLEIKLMQVEPMSGGVFQPNLEKGPYWIISNADGPTGSPSPQEDDQDITPPATIFFTIVDSSTGEVEMTTGMGENS